MTIPSNSNSSSSLGNMDDNDKMDLALNSEFDETLLDCWDSNATGKQETKIGEGVNYMSQSPRSNHSGAGGTGGWDNTTAARFTQLPNFQMGGHGKAQDDTATVDSSTAASSATQPWQILQQNTNQLHSTTTLPMPQNDMTASVNNNVNEARKTPPVAVSTAASIASNTIRDAAINTANSQSRLNQNQNKNMNHNSQVLGLEGKSAGPKNQMPNGMETGSNLQQSNQSTTSETPNTTQMHPLAIPSSANCPPHVITAATNQTAHANLQTGAGMQNSFFPTALSALGEHAAAAFAAAGLSFPMPNAQQQQQQTQQFNNNSSPLYPSQFNAPQVSQAQQGNANTPNSQAQPQPQSQAQTNRKDTRKNSKTKTPGNGQSTTPPPFYLFDAPVELRMNFMQSQRMHGLPVTEDSNSYHYGVAVNGFHPQMNAQMNPTNAGMPNSSAGGGSSSGGSQDQPPAVQLVDARHGSRKTGRVRNIREQKRAAKIADLISSLSSSMETGGWKVEVKSKFHTLSSCAEYVKHLMKTTKEKEEAVKKARADLQMKERKAEEDKAMQGSRSDPESVMSSLTSSTGDSGNSKASSNHHSAKKVSSENSSSEEGKRKRKSNSDGLVSNKKSRNSASGRSESSSESSGEDAQGSNQQSLGKTASSVSDITDSNKGSSNSGSDTLTSTQRSDDDDASRTPSSASASSSAAVAQGRDGKKRRRKHADVVIKDRSGDRPHKFPTEVTSLEDSFVLDYEEVFVKSNVPQIIATTAGRIIAWNDFFLKATGITKPGVKGLTIFSLVKQDKLSNLFEIVAKALRNPRKEAASEETGDGPVSGTEEQKWDYSGITLPCVDFPSSKERPSGKELVNPLYITVTLMEEEDPRKRLFHCVFTDCVGTNGALGSITPELLSMLFTRHRKTEASEPRRGETTAKKGQTTKH